LFFLIDIINDFSTYQHEFVIRLNAEYEKTLEFMILVIVDPSKVAGLAKWSH